MEWITVTASTVPEAKDQLLDKLGVPDGEAEFVVEEEGESKFFGLRRTQARVRARVRPREPESRRDRKRTPSDRKRRKPAGKAAGGNATAKPASGDTTPEKPGAGDEAQKKARKKKRPSSDVAERPAPASAAGSGRSSKPDRPAARKEEVPMEQVTARLQDFLDGLTDAFGVETSTTVSEADGNITAQVDGQHGVLVGPKGRTLDAIQELAKIAAFKGGTSSARIRVDVGEYRERRAAALVKFAQQAAEKAVDEHTEVVLEPMSSADRKVVHDALAGRDGIQTRSVGTDPRRRVVIAPADS